MKGLCSTKRQVSISSLPFQPSHPWLPRDCVILYQISTSLGGCCVKFGPEGRPWQIRSEIWSSEGEICFWSPELVPKFVNNLSSRSQSIRNIPIVIFDMKNGRVVFSFKPISNAFGVGFHSEFPTSQFILTFMFNNSIWFQFEPRRSPDTS